MTLSKPVARLLFVRDRQVPIIEPPHRQRTDRLHGFAAGKARHTQGLENRLDNPAVIAGSPNSDLALASGSTGARCNPRYRDYIDFIVLDRRATADLKGFEERTFAGEGLSDHCAISASLSLR